MPLFEILVPTTFGDTGKPVRLKHHRIWDDHARGKAGGLTILKPVKGQWLEFETNDLVVERVIPVRIATSRRDMDDILNFTIKHYRQKAVMAYELSNNVVIRSADESKMLEVRRKRKTKERKADKAYGDAIHSWFDNGD